MHFARTNLGLLLAHRSASATQRTARHLHAHGPRGARGDQRPAAGTTSANAAAAARTSDQTIEWVGAIATMAIVLVLALFG